MNPWCRLNPDEVVATFGRHSMLAHELHPDGVVMTSEAGWLVFHPGDDEHAAEAVIGCQQAGQIAGAVEQVGAMAAGSGVPLGGLSVPSAVGYRFDAPWARVGGWVWFSTRQLNELPSAGWSLATLDDLADAGEIMAFGRSQNPNFEGQPGTGVNQMWLGARDDQGALIGCAVIHHPGHTYGDLGGLVVHEAYRGRGLGQDLLVALARRVLAERGIVTLSAWAGSLAALRLYERVGFRRDHEFDLWRRA